MSAESQVIAEKRREADAVIIGAANGFSITEGINLFAHNDAFADLFGDLEKKYGIQCILQGITNMWPSPEKEWGFWSRLVNHYCIGYTGSRAMDSLLKIVHGKDYFILTSNGEGHFETAGLEKSRIWVLEGTWCTMQCSASCHDTLYPCRNILGGMAGKEKNGRVPSDLIPRCPKCGKPMRIQMAAGTYGNMIPDQAAAMRWNTFLERCRGRKIVFLELGMGPYNQLIKAPLMRLAEKEKNSFYVSVNLGQLYLPETIRDRSYGVNDSIEAALGRFERLVIGN
jgi:NAD-dependent SIR2 family protein deacetylase